MITGREDRRHHRDAARSWWAWSSTCAGSALTRRWLDSGRAPVRVVVPRGNRCRAGAAAMAAPIAGNFEGHLLAEWLDAVIGGRRRRGHRVGPIARRLGDDRGRRGAVVSAGEVVIVLVDPRRGCAGSPTRRCRGPRPQLDWVGAVLSAAGLAPGRARRAAVRAPGGGSSRKRLTGDDLRLLPDPVRDRRSALRGARACSAALAAAPGGAAGSDPLVQLDLFEDPPAAVRPGIGLFSQNLILMGVFFTVPLYLQLVLGLRRPRHRHQDAPGVDHHARWRPLRGSRARQDRRARAGVRPGGDRGAVRGHPGGCCATIKPAARQPVVRRRRWRLLGLGMGLLASQLGNVVQSTRGRAGPQRGGRAPVHGAATWARRWARR